METQAPAEVPLLRGACNPPPAPPMLLGLPRTLATLVLFLVVMGLLLFDGLVENACVLVGGTMVWFTVKEAVARDLWGFDNWLAWLFTDFRFLDVGGTEGWGGARLCALPLRLPSPFGVSRRAAR